MQGSPGNHPFNQISQNTVLSIAIIKKCLTSDNEISRLYLIVELIFILDLKADMNKSKVRQTDRSKM